jgi:acid ceramidase
MAPPPILRVDLSLPPAQRWVLSPDQVRQGQGLLAFYAADLGLGPQEATLAEMLLGPQVRADHRAEIEALATVLERGSAELLAVNSYYDIFKSILGCTGIAVDGPDGPIQARNLDWHSDGRALASATVVAEFSGAPAGTFSTVTWPGFIGALSGIAPGRFALSMNAVISDEPRQNAMPVALVLRQVLEEAKTWSEARQWLCDVPLTCDCLLLLTGVRTGELCVIERTPRKFAIREAEHGVIAVTNNFLRLSPGRAAGTALGETADTRLQRARALLVARPRDPDALFACLNDPQVRLGSTMQQMVMLAASGALQVRM